MTRRLLQILGTGAALLLPLGQPAAAETMASAVQRSLDTHPELAAFDLDRLAIKSGIDIAEGQRKPKISLSAQAGARGGDEYGSDTKGFSLSASQTLYDAGEGRSLVRRSRAESFAADSRYRDALIEIGLKAVQAYIEVQRTGRLVRVVKANLAALSAIHRRVKLRVDGGFGSRADIYQARSRLEAAREQFETAKQQYADAIADFAAITGTSPGKLETLGTPSRALPDSVEEAVRLSRRHSPRILAARYDALAADAMRSAAESLLAPRLNLRLGMDYDAEVEGFSTGNESATATLSLKVDLYDGGTRRARISQARYSARASVQTELATVRDVELEMRRAWHAIRASLGRMGPLERRAADAGKSLKLNLSRFKAGVATLDTILALQDEASASQVAALNENAAYRYNVFRVLGATGRLFPALGIEPHAEAAR